MAMLSSISRGLRGATEGHVFENATNAWLLTFEWSD
jgi:hypothetical protein